MLKVLFFSILAVSSVSNAQSEFEEKLKASKSYKSLFKGAPRLKPIEISLDQKSFDGEIRKAFTFGNIPKNSSQLLMTYLTSNNSTFDHLHSGPIISGSTAFSITRDTCSGNYISGGANCYVDFTYSPNDEAAHQTTVSYDITVYMPPNTSPVGVFRFTYILEGSSFKDKPKNKCEKGSIIDIDQRTVSEQVPIVGTNFSLVYTSAYDAGVQTNTHAEIPSTVDFNKQSWNPSIYHYYARQQHRLFLGSGVIQNREWSGELEENLTIVSDDGSEVYKFSWDGLHLETRTFLTGALKYQFGHDSQGRLVSITDGYGNATQISRDTSGKMTGITSPFGQTTNIITGANGKISSITNPKNETFSMTYGLNGHLFTFTKPGGQVTTLTYDTNGKLSKDLGNGGNFWDFIENVAGNISKSSQMGRTSYYAKSNDANNNYYRTSTEPSGLTSYYFENPYGAKIDSSVIAETTLEAGDDIRFGYKHRSKSLEKIKINNVEKITTFSETTDAVVGNPFSFTYFNRSASTNGKVFTENFNKTTMTARTTTPEGATTETVLNSHEQPVSIKTGADLPLRFVYDSKGRLSTSMQGAYHNQKTYSYNSAGFVESIRNGLNQVTSYAYDLAGNLTSVTQPDLRMVQYSYDANGNITSITPPSRPAHVFTFNAMELSSEYQPPALSGVLNVNTQYVYNLDKQLTQITVPSGETVVYNYNSTSGLLANIAVSGGTHVYSYHPNTDLVSRIDARDGIRSNYTYYGPFLASEEQRWGGNNYLFGKVDYQYDSEHRQSVRLVQGNSSSNSVIVTIQYNNDNQPVRIGDIHYEYTYPSGRLGTSTIDNISDSRVYDAYGNLSEYFVHFHPTTGAPQLLYSYSLTRDTLNRILTKTESVQGVVTTYAYTYDNVGRLSTVHRNGLPYSCYFYDSNGNRTHGVINGVPFTATYDDQDRVLTYAGKTYTHTADGYVDIVTYPDATTQQYVFDTLGNFRTVKLRNGQTEFYQHDGQYRLVSMFLGSTLQYRRLYAENDRIVAKVNNSGYLSEGYVHGIRGQTPEYIHKNSQKYRVMTDHLGSVRLVVNTNDGTIGQRMDYNEWGDVLNDTSPGFQPYGFAGGIYLPASKTVKFGARIYDPSMGRWLTKDPIRFYGGDANLYGYVFQNPINYFDPNGTDAWIEGASPGSSEPPFHQSISVGDPNGAYESFSFAYDFDLSAPMQGHVYPDDISGGERSSQVPLTPQEDAFWIKKLKGEVGTKGDYGPFGQTCRGYSQSKLKEIKASKK